MVEQQSSNTQPQADSAEQAEGTTDFVLIGEPFFDARCALCQAETGEMPLDHDC